MTRRLRKEMKAYAMLRMAAAISRAIESDTPAEKTRAARWAAAWGVMGGIRSPGVRLRRSVLVDRRRSSR